MSPRRRTLRKWTFIVLHPIRARRWYRSVKAPWPEATVDIEPLPANFV